MLIWKPSLPKYNFQMAQVMQWPPAIRNYMRKVRLKYQHVPPLFILYPNPMYCMLTIYLHRCSLRHEKKLKCGKPAAYICGQICSDLIYYVYVVKLLSNVWENGNYMLIFQPHLSHIITNSWQPLHDLSHSKISIPEAIFF